MCGCQVERYEIVCEEEACQLRALGGQAMLAVAPYDAPRAPGKLVYSSVSRAQAGPDIASCA
ncbi:hypothetical protein [Acidipila sp. EB88]|uniref:hypothetical protein n=1 Tax=Acidipila sp. EB88 TaxID=2305226 RepID=UPI000F5E1DFF|nr:hypothetical protein [Acidipila sp. EB88]RRA49803.1 hypothetical protein D1Y84_17565 [Acidipila sp. EB88]